MTKRNQVYRCEKCGNLINVVHDADANLVCCGEEMKLLVPNTVDAALEKHIPIVEKNGSTVNISVKRAFRFCIGPEIKIICCINPCSDAN